MVRLIKINNEGNTNKTPAAMPPHTPLLISQYSWQVDVLLAWATPWCNSVHVEIAVLKSSDVFLPASDASY